MLAVAFCRPGRSCAGARAVAGDGADLGAPVPRPGRTSAAATSPTAAGLAAVVAVIGAEGAITVVDALGFDLPAGSIEARPRLAVLAVVGFGFLGFLDDLGGVGQSGGFRGHLRALARGELTTGAIKLFGGAALSIVVVAIGSLRAATSRSSSPTPRWSRSPPTSPTCSTGRPAASSRAAPSSSPSSPSAPASGTSWRAPRSPSAPCLALLVPDLRERAMLGDVGANALGAVLGVGVVVTCSPEVRIVVLVLVAALNLLSEVVSFSKVIDRHRAAAVPRPRRARTTGRGAARGYGELP